jgi:acetate kinase
VKQILVLNLGSTSFKFKLYAMGEAETMLASGGAENIGAAGRYYVAASGRSQKADCACPTHADALDLCMAALARLGVAVDMAALDAVGYKAVHGGRISGSRVVDGEVIAEMERMIPFAPAHNPVYLAMMRSLREKHPAMTQIACFETAFHATIPLERAVYGVPYEWIDLYGLRRYGFHGSSHSYIAWKMGREAPAARRIVSAHLGGSSSLCAILDGRSVANSLGATLQSGVFHNNRVGDLDIFCLPTLSDKLGGQDKALDALATRGGFLGLSGVSNDLRAVEQAAEAGNARAELAIAAFADAVAGYVGMYTAHLGALDALVFTGGIGLNAASLRERIAKKLSFLGARLDTERNLPGYEGVISAPDSGVSIWSVETNEELMVARSCAALLRQR